MEIHVEARAGDVMAGAGGAAGPAPDVRHQPPGLVVDRVFNFGQFVSALLAKGLRRLDSFREVLGFPESADFCFSKTCT
jgi:hypothetical protein